MAFTKIVWIPFWLLEVPLEVLESLFLRAILLLEVVQIGVLVKGILF